MLHIAPSELISAAPATFQGSGTASNATPQRTRVLLVDDDEIDRILFVSAMKRADPFVECITFARAEGALDWLRTNTVDMMVVDLRMPGMSGFDFMKEIGDRSSLSDVPVVVFSTSSSDDDRERAMSLGAESYRVKPSSREAYEGIAADIVGALKRDGAVK